MVSKFVVFHHDDSDGLIGAYAIQAKLQSDQISFVPCNYAKPVNLEGIDGAEVYFVDFIPNDYEKVFAEIAERAEKLIIFDHHSSKVDAVEKVNGWGKPNVEITVRCEVGTSGGLVAWDELFPDTEPPQFFQIISDFDTFNLEKGKEDFYDRILPFQFGFMAVHDEQPILLPKISKAIAAYLQQPDEEIFVGLMAECFSKGRIIFNYLQQSWAKAAENSAFEAEFEGLRAICINTADKGSMQFDSVYDPEKHDLMFGFEWRKDHWSISLYSESDKVNCGEIAKKFGGGGHAGAAGCQIYGDVFSYLKPSGTVAEAKRRALLAFSAEEINDFCESCGIVDLADQFTESFGDKLKCWLSDDSTTLYIEEPEAGLDESVKSAKEFADRIMNQIVSKEEFKDFPDPTGIVVFKR